MTEKIKNQQRETIQKWQEENKEAIESCMDEIHQYAVANPTARTVVLRRKKMTDDFKIALAKACEKEGMVAVFECFGRIKVWFHDWQYLADVL